MARTPAPFDELDYQILLALRENARQPAADIARLTGANERTVRNRIDRMVESGAIRLTSIVDPHAFGYINTVDIFLEIDPDQEQVAIENLLNRQEITYLALGQGTKEVSIEGRFKDIAEMREFLGRVLPAVAGVRVTGYALVPRILRNIDSWLPKADDFAHLTDEE